MVSNSFQQTTPKRRAAWLALLAILLIVVAPLISVSLQKDPMSAMPGMHHAMMMDSSSASMAQMPGHKMAMMHSTDGATHTGHEMPLDHAEACGYCVLLAHAPFRAGAVRRHAPAAHSPAGFSPGIKALALLSLALPRNPRPAAAVCFFPLIKTNLRTAQRPLLL
ncbi:TPA: DUF2946 family protein [Klebsiella pneumoniae]